MRTNILLIIIFITINANCNYLFAQRDTINPPALEDVIEDFISNSDVEGEFDFNSLFEDLEYYQKKPLNLNKATQAELRDMGLLTEVEITSLLNYREQLGDFIAVYELQSIPAFSESTIRRILPYVKVGGDLDDVQLPIGKMFISGKNEVLLRWSTIDEVRKLDAFFEEQDFPDFPFLGDPNRAYIRYKYSYENKLSYGFTAEKDMGEEFFKGSNPNGFDFYSAHVFLKNYSKRIRAVALGDYNVSMGQGLILYSGFARGKSSDVTNIRRNQNPIKGYTSVGETLYMRGGGVNLGLTDKLDITAFGSINRIDANILAADTLDLSEQGLAFSSFQTSGLHRTASEIEDEDALQQRSIGGIIKYKTNNFHIALNALHHQFDSPLSRRIQPYNQFSFNGDQLFNISLDYSYLYKNFNFFGETARSDNGGLATINGLLIGLDRKVDMAILHRYFQVDYQSIDADPFAESGGGANEQGLYMGIEVRPSRQWNFRAYYDIWRHPWLRFGVDAPSNGSEYLLRLTYNQKRKMQAYVQLRSQSKYRNVGVETPIDYLAEETTTYLRFHFSSNVTPIITMRSRAEFSFFSDTVNPDQKGYLVYQDIIFKPKQFPISFTTRYAIFNTDDWDSRIYAYENSILRDFFVPAYYKKGTRFYFNARYKGIRNLTLELHFSRTYWDNRFPFAGRVYDANRNVIAEIDLPTRTQVKLQAKYKF